MAHIMCEPSLIMLCHGAKPQIESHNPTVKRNQVFRSGLKIEIAKATEAMAFGQSGALRLGLMPQNSFKFLGIVNGFGPFD